MPTVTFLGPFYETRNKTGSWVRGEQVEVTQEWLEDNQRFLPREKFKIEGGVSVPTNKKSAIPDENWNRKDMISWLKDKGVQMGNGYLTKSAALLLVQKHINEGDLD